jgi:hypothetical protein
MSYSRWSKDSRWYTFWSSTGASDTQYKWPTKSLKRSQIFEICDMPSYCISYGDLVDRSRSSVLKEIENHFGGDVTWDELNQLQDYFARFIRDVDKHFEPWEFFKYEWLKPTKYKIHRIIKKIIWKHL